MANKKPMASPVAINPDYPSLAEVNERAMQHTAERQHNMESAYAACPQCGTQLTMTRPEILPTAYEPTRPVVCSNCGYRGSIVQGY